MHHDARPPLRPATCSLLGSPAGLSGGERSDAIERVSELQAIERRIAEITRLLASSADPADLIPADQVGLGSLVTLRHVDGTTDAVRVGIVVEDNATVVTPDSPLGHALLGRHTGQDITWPTPAGPRQARVVQISQPSA